MLLQMLCNFANDYGDFKKGVDGAHRVGPQRELQSGEISEKEMRKAMAVVAAICLISGALLLFVFAGLTWKELAVFAALGIGAVLASLLYTLGKHPYGYRGLGDLYCFLFFGWAAVAGTFYLATKQLDFSVLLPASAMGFLSNAVLNINNMRDIGGEMEFREGGLCRTRAALVLDNSIKLLEEMVSEGLFTDLEKGIFGDVKRPKTGGKGLACVRMKKYNYFNPFIELMKGKR
jgi:1,4-dihydroxy-2-naphthoate octaprenyltransferase